MQKKVTIYDVAERLGISTATVNRAMNDKGSISIKTKRLVQETAREMGYRPSKSASSLKRNPRRIAVLLPDTIHGYLAEVEKDVYKAAEELAEYNVECEVFKENDENMDVFVQKLYKISDIFPEIALLMEEGVIDATIFQNPFRQGRMAFQYLYEYMVEGRRFDTDIIYLDPRIILRSNLCLYRSILDQMKDDIMR